MNFLFKKGSSFWLENPLPARFIWLKSKFLIQIAFPIPYFHITKTPFPLAPTKVNAVGGEKNQLCKNFKVSFSVEASPKEGWQDMKILVSSLRMKQDYL